MGKDESDNELEDCLNELKEETLWLKEPKCKGLLGLVTRILLDELWVIVIGETTCVLGTNFMLSTTQSWSLDDKEGFSDKKMRETTIRR